MNTEDDTISSSRNDNDNIHQTNSYLTLGDGDFTFSYDLCRFLQAEAALVDMKRKLNTITERRIADSFQSKSEPQTSLYLGSRHATTAPTASKKCSVSVTCSGIDPLSELKDKYKDFEFVSKKIKSLNGRVPLVEMAAPRKISNNEGSENENENENENEIKQKQKQRKAHKRPRNEIRESSMNTTTRTCIHSDSASPVTPIDDSGGGGGEKVIHKSSQVTMHVSMRHSINAIVPWCSTVCNTKDDDTLPLRASETNTSTTLPKPLSLPSPSISPSPPPPPSPSPPLSSQTYKRVIFNHPHIGHEDAQLHARFLSHFFHSVHTRWLAPDGIVHLALVKGQCERWKCLRAAEGHGFVLVHRGNFVTPPSPGSYIQWCLKELQNNDGNGDDNGNDNGNGDDNGDGDVPLRAQFLKEQRNQLQVHIPNMYRNKQAFKCRFQHRRHQSGRSFASRAKDGSETLSFARKADLDRIANVNVNVNTEAEVDSTGTGTGAGTDINTSTGIYRPQCLHLSSFHLPWQHFTWNQQTQNTKKLQCPYCDKYFADERARKNHVKCVHDGKKENQNQKEHGRDNAEGTAANDRRPIFCKLCGKDRIFSNQEALSAHHKAKHSGLFTDIKPDWAKASASASGGDDHQRPSDKGVAGITPKETLQNTIIGRCQVCKFEYTSEAMEMEHFNEFIPEFSIEGNVSGGICHQVPNKKSVNDLLPHACVKCNKRFRDQRARMQHENFCSA